MRFTVRKNGSKIMQHKKLKIAILGFGSRGVIYSLFVKNNPDLYEFAAVIDISDNKLNKAQTEFDVPKEVCFNDYKKFLISGIKCDLVAVCTMDEMHLEHATACLYAGLDLILEKPLANNLADCQKIVELAEKLNKKVIVCHVLRYTAFFRAIKEVIDSGEIGDVVNISQIENVGYWHQAHSFVRGNWGNKDKTSPMILQKCCHDLDIIKWLMGEKCVSVSSYGDLYQFKKENKPENSSDRCYNCALREDCLYDAIEFYQRMPGWAAMFVVDYNELDDAMQRSNFGRCVYACDNNVVDHQVVNMLFNKNKTAQLTMTAFSDECYRSLKIFGTKGEIIGNIEERKFTVKPFKKQIKEVDLAKFTTDFSVHQGGDNQLMRDVYQYLTSGTMPKNMTNALTSLESHAMAFAAETSRLKNGEPQKI